MNKALLVGAGGFLGTVLRYGIGVLLARRSSASFPFATLIVNVVGCLAIGVLAGMWESRGLVEGTARAFLFVGVLGGFTTFSSLGYETFDLVRSGNVSTAIASVALQLGIGLAAVWLGFVLGTAGRATV